MFLIEKSKEICLFVLFVSIVHAQKQIFVDSNELNVMMIGNIGVSEDESVVKRGVVNTITRMHEYKPFHLGVNTGNNVLPAGSIVNDFQKLNEVFGISFPSNIFRFDFLTVLGSNDHKGDFDTKIKYHHSIDKRFYLPKRNYVYDVTLSDGTSIRFMCIDSVAIYEPGMMTHEDRLIQINNFIDVLDQSSHFDYVFIVMHSKVANGCGRDTDIPNDPTFIKFITYDYITAILTGHDYNMQVCIFD
ncbi:hypothetical protein RF11_03389 [Thelohanellus kitauei]|uniref:Calcineurin-like phosphoesterase domain-containing protein n=1 Tax=Thelohanellus kitauei TaxID=669202 RepID=A0A0C2IHI6_THEKT|nr:hypothetical protein RF11_03389 [Thelohanellus kitauei]